MPRQTRYGWLRPAAALLVVALAGTASRADPIGYGYEFLTPTAVTGDAGNLGSISFATTVASHAADTAVLTAASITAVSAAPPGHPDTFNGQTFNLTLRLSDDPSGQTGTLTFTGKLFGTLSAENVNVTSSFDPAVKQLKLGNDLYTVRVGPLSVDPNPTVVGTLFTTVSVAPAGSGSDPSTQVDAAPEPSGLALALFGGLAAAVRWRRRRV